MKNNRRGVTLIELIAVMVLIGTLGATFSGPLADFLSPAKMIEKLKMAQLATDSQAVIRTIRNYFSRARDFQTQQFGAATAAGTLVSNQGAIVLRGDYRDCATFNPAAPVWTTTAVLCCQPGITMNVTAPGGLGVVNLTSACPANTWGLTLVQFNGAAVVSRQCFRDVIGMNIFNLGPQALTYGNTAAATSNALLFEFVGQSSFIGGRPSPMNASHFTLSTSPGNTPNNPLVTCSKVGQFN